MTASESRIKILLVTDVPYWKRSSGSQQRVAQMHRELARSPMERRTLWVGSPGERPPDERDERGACRPVRVLGNAVPPSGWVARCRWHLEGIVHAWSARRRDASAAAEGEEIFPRRLRDLEVPALARRFSEVIELEQPDVIWIEYLHLAYLVRRLPQRLRSRVIAVIDTHDVMHRRAEQHREQGLVHWLEVDRREEAWALSTFDVIVAIQPAEAVEFRAMLPGAEVVVAGYALDLTPPAAGEGDRPEKERGAGKAPVVIGYLGSDGDANRLALRRFLDEIWPELSGRIAGRGELWIAGPVARSLARRLPLSGVRLDERMTTPADFFREVDIVINPATIDTGLKIKTIEGLAAGRCVVASPAGLSGIELGNPPCARCCSSPREWVETLERLVESTDERVAVATAALDFSRRALDGECVGEAIREVLVRRCGKRGGSRPD